MSESPLAPPLNRSDRVPLRLRRQLEAIKDAWWKGTPPDALAALDQHPQLGVDPVLCIDLAYEEYCIRRDAGEDPDVEAFCNRFPSCRSSLRRLIGAHGYFSGIPEMIDHLPNWPEPGECVGDFTVVRELGRGALARAFLATEASTGDRPVVLKLSPHENTEAHTLGRLDHANIVPVLSAYTRPDRMTVICMPYQGAVTLERVLDGLFSPTGDGPPRRASALQDLIERSRRPDDPEVEVPPAPDWLCRGSYEEAVLYLGEQLALALDFLHRHRVCHRDLKPSNLLLRPDGRLLLLDFNLSADARLVTKHAGGTVPYMAPEQIQMMLDDGPGESIDERADLFSFGVILYELLTGRHPFGPVPAGVSVKQAGPVVLGRQRQGCLALSRLCPRLPGRVTDLLERCLAFDRHRRPASAAAVLAELRRHFLRRQKRRRRSWLAVTCLALVSTTLLGAALRPGATPLPEAAPEVRPVSQAAFQAGLDAYNAGRYRDAADAFTRVLDAEPLHADALFLAGRTQIGLVNYVWAQHYFEEALNVERSHSWPGVIGMAASPDGANGLLVANTVLAKEGACGPTLAYLAYCDSGLRDHRGADRRAGQAISCGFATAAVYNNRAYSLLQRVDYEGARCSLEEALRLDPHLQAAHLNCVHRIVRMGVSGLVQVREEILRDALAHLEAALRGKNQDPEMYRYGARLHALAARDDPAGEAVHKAQAIGCLQEALRRGAPADAVADVLFADIATHPSYSVLQSTPRGTVPAVRLSPFLADPMAVEEK